MATPARLAMVISAKSPSGISYLLLLLTTTKQPKIFLPNINGHFRMCLQQQVFFLKYLAVFAKSLVLCFKSIIS